MPDVTRNFTNPLNDPPRSLTTTLAPRAAKNTAYAFPNPPPAPVTTAVCLSNLSSDMTLYIETVLVEGEKNVNTLEDSKTMIEGIIEDNVPCLGTGLRGVAAISSAPLPGKTSLLRTVQNMTRTNNKVGDGKLG